MNLDFGRILRLLVIPVSLGLIITFILPILWDSASILSGDVQEIEPLVDRKTLVAEKLGIEEADLVSENAFWESYYLYSTDDSYYKVTFDTIDNKRIITGFVEEKK